MASPKGGPSQVGTRTRSLRRSRFMSPFALRAPSILWIWGLFWALCVAIIFPGEPSPGVSVAERSPRTFVARERFTHVDLAATEQKKKEARERVLSVYRRDPSWRNGSLRTARALLDAATGASTLEAARSRLRAEGIELDPAPLWQAARDPGGMDPEGVSSPLEEAVLELEKMGVVEDARAEKELAAGRRGITLLTGRTGVEEKALELGGRPGVTTVSRALERISRGLVGAFRDRPELVRLLVKAVGKDLGPSLVFNSEHTRRVKDRVESEVSPVEKVVWPGAVIVRKGKTVTPTHLEMIRREVAAYYSARPMEAYTIRLVGLALTVGVVVGLIGTAFVRLARPAGGELNPRYAFWTAVLNLAALGGAKLIAVFGWPAALAPIALVALLLSVVVSPLFAFLNTVGLACLSALVFGPTLTAPVALGAGAAVAALGAARARRRSDLLRAGAYSGMMNFVALIGLAMLAGTEDPGLLFGTGGWGLVNGFACGLVGVGLLPVMEYAFGVTTEVSLLELSDQNHPALRKLLIEAPGTYHHSLIVGNLSEAAAEAVGANALLARVASLYHDLGKIERPEYFVENEPHGRSRHEGLKPTISALIITSHVRDGVSLAGRYGIPRAITDIIQQHHGTTLVEFFYRSAQETARGGPKVEERLFRYPGPRPRTKEAGIVLLADSIEAASRTLAEPTPAHVSKLVRELTMKRLLDGQFDDSGLTFRDIKVIQERASLVLLSMFHSRVPYPSDRDGRKEGP